MKQFSLIKRTSIILFMLLSVGTFAQELEESLLVASMERTTCYGNCPYYEVRVYSNGIVTYRGRKNVEYIGLHQAKISPNQVEKLLDKAKSIGYVHLENKYPVKGLGIIDFPVCITSIKEGDVKKVIYNRNDSPQRLVEYQDFFDELIEDIEWEKVDYQN